MCNCLANSNQCSHQASSPKLLQMCRMFSSSSTFHHPSSIQMCPTETSSRFRSTNENSSKILARAPFKTEAQSPRTQVSYQCHQHHQHLTRHHHPAALPNTGPAFPVSTVGTLDTAQPHAPARRPCTSPYTAACDG